MKYIAIALNTQGKIAQLRVTVTNGKTNQQFTGKIYKSMKEAKTDMIKSNCQGCQGI